MQPDIMFVQLNMAIMQPIIVTMQLAILRVISNNKIIQLTI